MWTARERTDRPVEVACDESGYEHEALIGATTDVFAHASVRLDTTTAAACIQELRDRIRSPAEEYKANHVLREKHRRTLEWLLGTSGPLLGQAHVYLIDKAFFVVGKVVDLLIGGVTPTAGAELHQHRYAAILCRQGRDSFDPARWRAFLVACNDLMRGKERLDPHTSVDAFFAVVDALRQAGVPEPAGEILDRLHRARPRAQAYRERLLADPAMLPVLDPLIPAIARAVAYWGAGTRPVEIVHDQQNTLAGERIGQLLALLGGAGTGTGVAAGGAAGSGGIDGAAGTGGAPGDGGRLVGLRLVDSRWDPRVQVADFLAGVARKLSSDELNGRGEAALTALLRPFLDAASVWGDDGSRVRLRLG